MTLNIIVPGPLKELYFTYRELVRSIKFIKLINNLEHYLIYFQTSYLNKLNLLVLWHF